MKARTVHAATIAALETALVTALGIVVSTCVPAAHAQLELHGFVEGATAVRVGDAATVPAEWGDVDSSMLPRRYRESTDYLLRESRLQLRGDLYGDSAEAHFVLDVLADQVTDETDVELRQAYAKFTTLSDHLDVRLGRQPTTWGTGDLLFINDLFPKDYVSFFSGREDQYLKRPSDVVRLGIFGLPLDVDLVITPEFAPDRVPTGERLAFWSPAFVAPELPRTLARNAEFATRLSRRVDSFQLAGYGYLGFWKNPVGLTLDDTGAPLAATHPRLRVGGASVRGPWLGGIVWIEGGYYDSFDDSDGSDPLVPNSEARAFVGYERQWWSDFTGGVQFYLEHMVDHDSARTALTDAFGEDAFLKEENRTLVTARLSQALRYQTLRVNLFVFLSPSDSDAYVRPSVSYDWSDELRLAVGANVFGGDDERTAFGMNDVNSSIWARVRYSF